jgi:hypothetical protein
VIDALQKVGVIPGLRAILRWNELDCGPPRPPLEPLNATEEAELRAAVEASGAEIL